MALIAGLGPTYYQTRQSAIDAGTAAKQPSTLGGPGVAPPATPITAAPSTGPFNTTSGANASNPTGAGVTRHIDPATGRWVAGPEPSPGGSWGNLVGAMSSGMPRNYGTASNPRIPMTTWGTPTQYSGPRSWDAPPPGVSSRFGGDDDPYTANAQRWATKDWYNTREEAKAAQNWRPGQAVKVNSRSPLGRSLIAGQRNRMDLKEQAPANPQASPQAQSAFSLLQSLGGPSNPLLEALMQSNGGNFWNTWGNK